MGAKIIEKHLTLNKNMIGPDHKASLEPNEFKSLIDSIRNIEKGFGNFNKKITKSEKQIILIARKSIVASRNIKKGEIFNTKNITVKRPATGISPMKWFKIIGKKLRKTFTRMNLLSFKKKILIISGYGSDYSLLKPLILNLRKDSSLITKLVITGSHLEKNLDLQYKK